MSVWCQYFPETKVMSVTLATIKKNVSAVIVGKEKVIDLLLTALLADGHVLLEDVPGVGKTMLAKALAKSLGLEFRRIQFTPDLLPSDVTGINYFNQKLGEFQFRPGPVMTGILLADEINRATPRTQASLLEAMEERQVTVDGVTRPLPRPFLVIATQNPVELAGTFPLPEAQLDRFLMKLNLGYPTEKEENEIIRRFERQNPLAELQPVVTAAEVLEWQKRVRQVRVAEVTREYLVRIVRQTREEPALRYGASPRGSLALYRAAQALALVRERDFVVPEDVKELAGPILGHRLILHSNARLKGETPEKILEQILEKIPVPVEENGTSRGR